MSTKENVKTEGQSPPNDKKPNINNKGSNNSNNNNRQAIPRQTKFEGECTELKGHIFDCSDIKQSELFIKTSKALAGHVGRTYKYSADIRFVVDNLELTVIDEPVDPPADHTRTQERIWQKKVDEFVARETQLRENVKTLYSLVLGQCTDIMKQKLEGLDSFETISSENNGMELLKSIKIITFQFQGQKFLPQAMHEAKRRFYLCYQNKYMTTAQYLEYFQNLVDVIDHIGGSVGDDSGLFEDFVNQNEIDIATADIDKIGLAAKDQYLAVAFLLGADRSRYGRLIESLENDHIRGKQAAFPKTLTSAYNLLTNWKQNANNMNRNGSTVNDGVSFTNIGEDGQTFAQKGHANNNKKGDTNTKNDVTCFKCNQKGHYAPDCPNDTNNDSKKKESGATLLMAGIERGDFEDNENFQFMQHGCVLKQNDGHKYIPNSWILLDNQSTVDVFHNADLLHNIREVSSSMQIHCNAGITSTNLQGDLAGYGTVWYHPEGIANILSLSRVKDAGYHIKYDSNIENAFIIERPNGDIRTFTQSDNGLFYMDVNKKAGVTLTNITKETANDVVLINTVAENKTKYTKRDYDNAMLARSIQKTIGRPSTATFLKIVENNQLPNIPITRQDILAAEYILGPDEGSLKGKTVRRVSKPVHTKYHTVPATIMSQYSSVTLAGDVMFINQIPFFVTVSRKIKFSTAEMIRNTKGQTLFIAIKQVISIYKKRGFHVNIMLFDGQFESIRTDLSSVGVTLNITSNNEHVPEIERQIRTIKERIRCIYNTLPFKLLPPRIIIELVYTCVFWLNCFPYADGISTQLSPRTIITGLIIDYTKHCQLEFGSYVQTHEVHDNTMRTRTTGALSIRPTGNMQGSYYFYSLTTGRVINRNHWTALPMPGEVIDRVHLLARNQRILDPGLTISNLDGNSFEEELDNYPDEILNDDNNIDIAGVINENEDNAIMLLPDQNEPNVINLYDNDNENELHPYMNNEDEIELNNNIYNVPILNQNEDKIDHNEEIIDIAGVPLEPENNTTHDNEDIDENEEIDNIPNVNEMDDTYGPRNHEYNLRPRRPRDYSHLHTTLESTVMTQYSLKKGISTFGDAGIEAVIKELQQLHDRHVIEPKIATELSSDEKYASLPYLMFLKEKRDGTIKGRGCADGRKQRPYTTKEEASSPTVAIESVLISCTIDAHEERDVATVDIPGAFMQADQEGTVHMKLEGTMAELLVKIDPKMYKKYIQMSNGKPILYVELRKALYGTLKAALLFWKKLTATLKSWGFIINPYDWCVANKIINEKQCTILWHVDDLKISHCDSNIVTSVISQIEDEFGREAPITKTRGKIHDYLGMVLDYSIPGKVKICMFDYIKKLIDESPPDMEGESATPAGLHLFEINENDPTKLSQKESDLFHHMVAKLLFLCKRARPDIQTAVSFLCTRVKSPDTDDYKKLIRVIKYLRGTKNMPLTLEAKDLNIIKWWVDASFAVHPDMRSHTGGAMSLGTGVIYGTSTKQKINTKSSTESELVSVNEVLPQILWTKYFLEEQGYKAEHSIIYQDNQSAMLLENNGRASSSKRTRHFNIRYFFVTDRIANKEVQVEYCPTKEMIADFFTKPLQGSNFKKFRDFIMNVDPALTGAQDPRSVLN